MIEFGEPPLCRAIGCRSEAPCSKAVKREVEHDGKVTFLCPAHRVVLRSHRQQYESILKVPCRHHAGQDDDHKCMKHRVNVWGWEPM